MQVELKYTRGTGRSDVAGLTWNEFVLPNIKTNYVKITGLDLYVSGEQQRGFTEVEFYEGISKLYYSTLNE